MKLKIQYRLVELLAQRGIGSNLAIGGSPVHDWSIRYEWEGEPRYINRHTTIEELDVLDLPVIDDEV